MNKKQLNFIARQLQLISDEQQADGYFPALSSPDPQNFCQATQRSAIFPTLLIGGALNTINESQPEAEPILAKIRTLINSQIGPLGSLNYWLRDSTESRSLPYPDDLDDTFCAALALGDKLTPHHLAQLIKLLTHAESRVGGPYYTWLVSNKESNIWRDIDIAVNANVAGFLATQSVTLPNLESYIRKAIKAGSYSSPYYPNQFAIFYYLARGYAGKLKPKLVIDIQRSLGGEHSLLDRALGCVALLKLGADRPIIDTIVKDIERQLTTNKINITAFCLDPKIEGEQYYSSSQALVRAIALEAYVLYHNGAATDAESQRAESKLYKRVDTHLKAARLTGYLPYLEKLEKMNRSHKITDLGRIFYQSLAHKPKKISDQFFINLSLASYYGWLSYTVADDIIDGDATAHSLPLALYSHRQMLNYFDLLFPPEHPFYEQLKRVLLIIDRANNRESVELRFTDPYKLNKSKLPKYRSVLELADRSFGHVLSIVAVLAALNYSLDGREVTKIVRSLQYLLAARQLNDEAHDWKEDFERGQLTYVSVELLNSLPKSEWQVVNMEREFAHTLLPQVATSILELTKKSRAYWQQSGLTFNYPVIDDLVSTAENAAHKALAAHVEGKELLKAYQQDS